MLLDINKLAVQLQSERKRTEKMQTQISHGSNLSQNISKKDLSLNFAELRRYDDENIDTSNITGAVTTRNSSRSSYRQLNYSQAKVKESQPGILKRNPSPNLSENESRPPTRYGSTRPASDAGKDRLPTFENSDNSLFIEPPQSRDAKELLRKKDREIAELKVK
jgi:hypothetical protein